MPALQTTAHWAALAAGSLIAAHAPAATLTWDSNGLTPGLGTGGGNWTAADLWFDAGSSTNVTWNSANVPPDDALFTGAFGTATVTAPAVGQTGAVAVGAASFEHTGVLTVNVTGGSSLTYAGPITVSGGGEVTLSGNHVPQSTISITNGTLNLNASVNAPSVTVAQGSTLRTNGNNQLGQTLNINGGSVFGFGNNLRAVPNTTSVVVGDDFVSGSTGTGGGIQFAGSVDLGSATRTITVQAHNLNFTGSVSAADASVGITKEGAGTLLLGGPNSYTGVTTVNAGTLQLNASNNSVINGDVVLAGGTLLNNQSNGIADGSTVTMTSGNWNFTGNRTERLQKLVFSGGSFGMSGTTQVVLTQATGGVTADTDLAVNVNLGGELAGDTGGSLNVGVVVRAGGILSPGSGAAGDVGTLGLGNGLDLSSLTSSASQAIVNFDIGSASDLIGITAGAFVGAGDSGVLLNLDYVGGVLPTVIPLIDWSGAASVTGVELTDFALGTVPSQLDGYELAINGNQLQLVIPEPTSLVTMAGMVGVLLRRRLK